MVCCALLVHRKRKGRFYSRLVSGAMGGRLEYKETDSFVGVSEVTAEEWSPGCGYHEEVSRAGREGGI